jgi:hypothetical protein
MKANDIFEKGCGALVILLLTFLLTANSAKATQITWTNNNSGNWETATNWSPPQVPGAGDTATISTIVTVTLTANESVANLNCSSATLVGTNSLLVLGQAGLTNATLALPLELGSQAMAQWIGGDLSGQLTVDNGAILTMTNSEVVFLGRYNEEYNITNSAMLMNNGTVYFKNVTFEGYSSYIQNSGDWEDLGGGNFSENGGNHVFVNSGTYNKSGNTSSTIFEMGWLFNSTGMINTETGSLYIYEWYGSNVLNGTLNWNGGTVLPNATLEVTTNSTLNWMLGDISGALTIDPGGILMITNTPQLGYYNFTSKLTNGAFLTNNGLVLAKKFTLAGYNALIQNNGEWDALTNSSFSLVTSTNLFVNAGLFVDTTPNVLTFPATWPFQTTGTIETPAAALSVSSFYGTNVINGSFALTNSTVPAGVSMEIATNAALYWQQGDMNGTLMVDAGGTLDLGTSARAVSFGVQNHSLKLTNISSVINSGTIRVTNSIVAYNATVQNSGLWETDVSVPPSGSPIQSTNFFLNLGVYQADPSIYAGFDNTWIMTNGGTINLFNGGLEARSFTQTAGATYLNGGGLTSPYALFLGGTLSGTGTITANVTNSATISPGTPVGTLNITGNFTQTASGAMNIYLGGPTIGVDDSEIVATGTTQTGGQLAVFLTNNFVPALEATYPFLRANGNQEFILPDFSSLQFPTNIANLSLALNSSAFGSLGIYVRVPVGPTFYNGSFVAQLLGIPGTNYTIEATTSLSPSDWQKVTNVTSGTASEGLAGVIQIIDPAVATNRFYRAVTPAY